MNRVLVVEDEKLIRQGIAAMIKKSGVPVNEVLECSNGLQALDILKETKVDVMFTDIRMPKMNGIELVKSLQNLEEPPITIAVSGYDDFSYAVEMMRQGVREYILKPVERDKLREVLSKLQEELEYRKENEKKTKDAANQLMKYLLEDEDSSEEAINLLEKRINGEVGDHFRVIVATPEDEGHYGITLTSVEEQKVYIVNPKVLEQQSVQNRFYGISDEYSNVLDLKNAYLQAKARRSTSFFTSTTMISEDAKAVNEELLKKGEELCSMTATGVRVQLIGTDRLNDLQKEWKSFFTAAERLQISRKSFCKAIRNFATEFAKVYRRPFPENLSNPLKYESLNIYVDEFNAFIEKANADLLQANDGSLKDTKIQAAIKYIEDNFDKDLNMAVVSNEISMNYSLFSVAFKNYTGENFVTYVKTLRMDKAKALLEETDLKVNEISKAVGYDNEKHFLKSFKAFVGVSPSEYRKNLLIGD